MTRIRVADAGGIRRITIDRPQKANALTATMLGDLRDAVTGAPGAALVLTGAGTVFSAGADLEAARAGLATSPLWEEVSGAVAAFPGLTIAALNGTCAGGAMGMALACDLRVAAPAARVFYPVMRMGVLPPPSDPGRLVALVGPSRAKLILMTGARIDAAEAREMGLVDRIADDPVAAAEALAADPVAAPAGHAAAIKRGIG